MELDFSTQWRIIGVRGASADGPAEFAAEELAAVIGRCPGCATPLRGDEGDTDSIIILDSGRGEKAPAAFSWRAAPGRVEIYGGGEAALLEGAYDFLGALGVAWVAPDAPGCAGERLPSGPRLELAADSGASSAEALPCTLILGHGCFLEDWEARIEWAARAGYSSIFIHTTRDALALGAAPAALYEALRPGIAAAARRRGLGLELGGHLLSSFLPRSLFGKEPELFRESGGERLGDRNFCPSSARALGMVAAAFSEWASAHPEIGVFHAWPDDLPGGGWCSCPSCAALSPAAQSLKVAAALASALAAARPGASLSFLAYHDTEGAAAAAGAGALPANLELLWAPRMRSWAHALGDADSGLNAASLAAFRENAAAWRKAGGGRISVFEYYEDAVLFKAAVPPLPSVIEGDLEAYRSGGAQAIGLLCAGGRLPLAPRPNAALLPRLAASRGASGPLLADWARAAYGKEGSAMLEYWRELEAAWAIDLDIEEGETAVRMPAALERSASDPPADWGDPWKAGFERLAARRERCEELFDHLRLAEARLAEASAIDAAALAEAREYAVSDAILELDCARLSAYHELAGGDARAAADIANLALSAAGAARKSLSKLPDKRSRREMSLLVGAFYELRLRAIRRSNARSGLRRMVDLWYTTARFGLLALRSMRAFEPRGGRGLARSGGRQ